jgi:uncharacterized protein (DUF169 family)
MGLCGSVPDGGWVTHSRSVSSARRGRWVEDILAAACSGARQADGLFS